MSNITEIPLKPDEMKAAVETMKKAAPALIEMASTMADIRWAHYLAYIEKGFTKEEALVLCQKVML